MASNGANVNTRVYCVKATGRFPTADKPPVRLVRASGRASAFAFTAADLFDVHLATQDEMETLLGQGVRIERAGAAD